MKLIWDTGHFALVNIDGIKWRVSSDEYKAMSGKPFHFWAHNLKRINPMPHSCARCLNRPFNFQDTKQRTRDPVPPCPCSGWSKAAPYYVNESCKAGAWELKLLCDFTQRKISSINKRGFEQ